MTIAGQPRNIFPKFNRRTGAMGRCGGAANLNSWPQAIIGHAKDFPAENSQKKYLVFIGFSQQSAASRSAANALFG
jgi:hypothetical protein